VVPTAEEPVVAAPVAGILSRAMLLAASQHFPESEDGAVVCALAKLIPATSIAAAVKAVILVMKYVLFRAAVLPSSSNASLARIVPFDLADQGPQPITGFLTTQLNAEVAKVHPEAMPVILTTNDEFGLWMSAE
jgi:hypothetical protein